MLILHTPYKGPITQTLQPFETMFNHFDWSGTGNKDFSNNFCNHFRTLYLQKTSSDSKCRVCACLRTNLSETASRNKDEVFSPLHHSSPYQMLHVTALLISCFIHFFQIPTQIVNCARVQQSSALQPASVILIEASVTGPQRL